MRSQLLNLTYEIELQPGDTFKLPPLLLETLRAGRWLITIQPAHEQDQSRQLLKHSAFLNSYALEDEGLYDDYTR